MRKIALIYISIFLVSCERNELPIEPHAMGEIQLQQINMQSDYSQQVFYNTSKNLVVSSNTKSDWDLGFHSSATSSQIIINSSTFSQICELEGHVFEDPISLTTLTWKWDSPQGIYTETAFNNPISSTTYILDRGYNIDGTQRGYKKIKVDSINGYGFFITYSELDNTDLKSVEINKDSTFHYQYFSFNNNETPNIEPEKDDWDLMFTQYTHLFIDNSETPAYLVTGVLTNYLNNVTIAKDTINSFEEISLSFINNYHFSQYQNSIGYNWKIFDFENQGYSIRSDITYIIKDVSNRYFKMHFIDFYNDLGEKGYPKFEIQEL